jgi:hypothetical protein
MLADITPLLAAGRFLGDAYYMASMLMIVSCSFNAQAGAGHAGRATGHGFSVATL